MYSKKVVWIYRFVSFRFYFLAAAKYKYIAESSLCKTEAECQLVYFLMRSLNKKTWAVLSQRTEDKCDDTPNQQET